MGLWGQQDWFWDVVDVTAVLQALDEQQKGQEPLTLERVCSASTPTHALIQSLTHTDMFVSCHRCPPDSDLYLLLLLLLLPSRPVHMLLACPHHRCIIRQALALTLSSLDDRFPWHRLQPVRDKILSLTGSRWVCQAALLLSTHIRLKA